MAKKATRDQVMLAIESWARWQSHIDRLREDMAKAVSEQEGELDFICKNVSEFSGEVRTFAAETRHGVVFFHLDRMGAPRVYMVPSITREKGAKREQG